MTKTSSAEKAAGALSLAAAAVAAVATGYYFYGKGGKAHRKEARDWTKKAKLDMLEKIKQMKDVTKAAYDMAAAEILAKYKQVKNIDPKELQTFGQELKAHWTEISKEAAKLTVKSPVKKIKAKTSIKN
jgi:hypothetical protein